MKKNSVDIPDFVDCSITSLIENGMITASDVLVVKKLAIKNKVCNIHNYRIYQGKGKDTRWVTYVTDPETQQRKKVIAPTEEELFNKLYMFYFVEQEEREKENWITLRKIYPEWLKYKSTVSNRMNTVRRVDLDYKRYYLNEPLSQDILDKPLDKVTLVDMETWALSMIREYEMTYKQYNNMALILRQVMDYLVKLEKLDSNRFRKIKLPSKCFKRSTCKSKGNASQIFFEDEVDAIVECATRKADETKDETFLAIPMMVCLGLRISECLGLSFEDFDSNNNTVHIHRSLAVVDEMLPDGTWAPRRYEVTDYLKQNAEPRTILASDECFAIVKHIRKLLLSKRVCRSLLFEADTLNNVEMKLYRICDELGIKRRSPHKLRKTYVSTLLNNGFDLDFVRSQVGHQDPRTTLNSYTFSTTRDEEKISKLNQVI